MSIPHDLKLVPLAPTPGGSVHFRGLELASLRTYREQQG